MTVAIQLNLDDDWETPIALYNKALTEYGVKPKLDVAATLQNRKCLEFFTKEDDALKQDWDSDFFGNPPYSQVDQFVRKAYSEYLKRGVDGLFLVFAKTDTRWWHDCIEGKADVHFIKGRVKFCKDNVPGKYPAPYPSCWIIWRNK